MSYKDLTRVAPYNDDFNPELNFLRILSVPGRPIQSRELTQAQTILQNQIAQVASHLFRNGTPVLGAKINLNLNKPGCRFVNRVMVDRATGVTGSVALCGSAPGAVYKLSDFVGRTFNSVDPLGINLSGVATKTFTVSHAVLSKDESELILYFTFGGSKPLANDLFFDSTGSGGTALKATSDLFFGMAASCEPGIIYKDGSFVSVLSQEIIVGPGKPTKLADDVVEDEFNMHASYAIGFRFDERIITESDPYFGSTLNDNAQGFYNQAAPGAHRYQVMPVLDFYDKNYNPVDGVSPVNGITISANAFGANSEENAAFNSFLAKFSTLVETTDGNVTLDQRDTQYAKLLDLLARRTYDESGNYSVSEFSISVKDKNSSELYYELGPGKAYVLGYEISKLSSTRLDIPKARDYIALNNTYALAADHSYFVIENSAFEWPTDGVPVGNPLIVRNMDLRSGTVLYGFQTGITLSTGVSPTTGSSLGTCRVHSLVKYGTEWRLYVHSADSNFINNARSIKTLRLSGTLAANNPLCVVSSFEESRGADIAGTSRVSGNFRDPLVYEVNGATILKDITASETSYIHMVKKTGTTNASGVITFVADNNNQEFFSSTEDGIVLVTVNTGGVWTQPAVVDVSGINNSTNPATITLDLGIGNATKPVDAYFKVLETEGNVRSKIEATQSQTFSAFIPNSSSSVTLSQEDILEIVSVRQENNVRSDFGTATYDLTASDIAKLTLDTGQRDFYYAQGSVSGFHRLSTYNNSSTPTLFTIVYKYFNHSAGEHGFFCVNSYPYTEAEYGKIPTYKSSNGKNYRLINCIDFRPKLTAILGRTVIQPSSRFRLDANTFTGRSDRVVLTSTGEFKCVQGISSLSPELPSEPSNAMTLYTIQLSPYTFSNKDLKVKKIDNRRYTMRDIGELDKRLSNLEEYTAMSLLELRANDLEVIDSVTGFNKFKNGIFADPFRGHQFGDTGDTAYRCASEVYFGGGITCPSVSVGLELDISPSSTIQEWPNLITLPVSSSEVFIKNEFASGSINVNPYLFYSWNGTVTLDPVVDTWMDVERVPDIINASIGNTIIQQNVTLPLDPQPTLSLPSMAFMVCGMTPEDQEATFSAYNSAVQAIEAQYNSNLAAWQQRQADRQNATTGGSSSTTITETVNDRVVATNIAPFMRSIPVGVHSKGLRQGAPLRAFLDNVEVTLIPSSDEYITPPNDQAGSNLPRVGSNGEFVGSFVVPAGVIPTGTKQFVIVDYEDTSSATTNFSSSGSIQVRQRTITSVRNTITRINNPINPIAPGGVPVRPRPRPTSIPRDSTSGTPITQAEPWHDPIAQSFLIEEPGGVFLSSIDVFFKKKPSAGGIDDQPVVLYIVEMENGYPTNRIVPLSEVQKTSSQITAHATIPSQGANTFTFSDPVYLEGLTEYAFVLFSNSRGYEAWISTLGEQDIFNYLATVGGTTTPVPSDVQRSIGIEAGPSQTAFLSDRFRSSGGSDLPVQNPSNSGTNEQSTVQSGELNNGSFLPRIDPSIGLRGSNSGGRGIAEQPYLGSLFKSQNSTTWTADQLSDITFRMRRYKFSTLSNPTLYLLDRKYIPRQVITTTGTGVNTKTTAVVHKGGVMAQSLYPYPDQIYGDSETSNNPGKLKVAATILNIGEMILPGTSLTYSQAFHSGETGSGFVPIVNKRLTYLGSESYLDFNSNALVRKNYTAQISFFAEPIGGTGNISLLSPVIDKQQMKLIASRYLTSLYDLSTNAPDLVDAGWDAGTYISKTVNLLNASDDLKVLVDAKLPNDSYLKLFYRTSEVTPSFFNVAPSNITSTGLIGKVCRLIFRKTTGLVGNPNSATPNSDPSFTNPANPKVRCQVTNIELNSASPYSVVYVKSVNDLAKFNLGSSFGVNINKAFIVDETTAVDIESQNVQSVPDWSNAVDYSTPDANPALGFANPQYVIFQSRLWKRNANFTQYTTGMEPAVGGSAWIDIPWAEVGTAVTASTPVNWRELVLDEEVNPNLSVGTRFVEYKYRPVDVPEDFTSFAVKIEMYSMNPVNVPIVKNLRAIAVI